MRERLVALSVRNFQPGFGKPGLYTGLAITKGQLGWKIRLYKPEMLFVVPKTKFLICLLCLHLSVYITFCSPELAGGLWNSFQWVSPALVSSVLTGFLLASPPPPSASCLGLSCACSFEIQWGGKQMEATAKKRPCLPKDLTL